MLCVFLLALAALLACARAHEGGTDCGIFENECKELQNCDLGIEKIDGADDCERCKCRQNPCHTTSCAAGKRCVLQKSIPLKDTLKKPLFSAECVTMVKAGACPREKTSPLNDTCPRECADDADCRGVGKCCRRGCSLLCLEPIQQSKLHIYLLALAFATDKIVDKDPVRTNVRIPGDENATEIGELGEPFYVRCLASGNPPHSVYWYRNHEGAEELHNDTMYEPADNVLLIRSLNIDTLGPYTCRAYNGAGAPASWVVTVRAYKPPGLFIDHKWLVARDSETTITTATATDTPLFIDAERVPAEIVGDKNATVTGELGEKFLLQCHAYGYPLPSVYWYRDHVGAEELHDDTVYKATDNDLLIRSLNIDTLGPYTCRAYNGAGAPASWVVTVQAYKPPGLFIDHKWLVARDSETTITTVIATDTPLFIATDTTESIETTEGSTSSGAPTEMVGTSSMDPCSGFQFGCCAENETEASGPDGQGCPDNATESGCCPDGVREISITTDFTVTKEKPGAFAASESSTINETTANDGSDDRAEDGTSSVDPCSGFQFGEISGSDEQGCPDSATESGCCPDVAGFDNESPRLCSSTLHGCCQDDKTPAHGPDFEGCCLLQPFKCCPDNRKPAEGLHLEGCGCQNALHGCCPDNVTIAQGPDNLGCGCQYTQHGCCPDRFTVASGPNNEGCACKTHQFGCCPDGITIAKSPNQQGCHCRDSKFGCCRDGETPATGPDAAGCDCSSSRHGCCPDGRTEAAGPKFLGCTDAPEKKQAACSMSTYPGPCKNFTAVWYYDMAYGGCSRFWYGGCDGNGNRFATKEECEDVCVQPSPKDACKLPSVKGPCDADYQRWHYNSTREQCIPFRYGGCLGNANNFDSRELCQKQCEPSSVTGECDLPIDQGSCAGNFSRWGFNSEAHRCEQFIWGGCEGNSNRFSSEAACQMRCAGTQPPQCTQPQEAGNCTKKEALWSFSQSENRCLPFYYSGCGGNDNRFGSREACEQTCPSAYVPDKCTLPYETGECSNYRERWFYDTTYKTCRQFYYGGCGGNENNFATQAECDSSCSEVKTTTTTTTTTARPAEPQPQTQRPDEQQPRPSAPERAEFCFNPIDAGPCNNIETRYAYDSELGRCVTFQYGGCGGNQNNFPHEAYCSNYCQPIQDICQLPMLQGPCDDSLMRWFYDPTTDSCSQFTYGGCEGNDNRFESFEACENRCRTGPAPAAHTTPTTTAIANGPPECRVTESLEECRYGGVVWYFEPSRHECVSHANQEAGALCRYTGTFPTQEACERSCGAFVGVDPAQVPIGNAGDENALLAGEFGKPLFVHCLASEYPLPAVSWFFGFTLLNNDTVYEVIGNVLLIRSLAIETLGEYTCKVNNGEPKAMSWGVVVLAFKPEGLFLENKFFVQRTTVSPRCSTKPPTTKDTTTTTTTASIKPIFTVVKVGACDGDETTTSEVSCSYECVDDTDCQGVGKCCRRGCSEICQFPDEQTSLHPLLTTTTEPNVPAAPQVLPQQEPKVETTEGGAATLRCLFHGNPPPKITWRFGGLTIDGNAGRYRLTSDGALEIVSLYRNDTGVYICVADNGLGEARQETHLVVNDPVSMPVEIAGDENAVVTGELGQPLHVRCLAYGYPAPSVSWYYGYGEAMVPYNDAVYESRGNFLLIRSLTIETLGEYTCRAYNGEGKAASWVVLVRAYMPEGLSIESDFLVSRDALAPRPKPQAPATAETTTTTTTTTTEAPRPLFTVPVSTHLSSPSSTLNIGAELHLSCEVDGFPDPDVYWTKDGVNIKPDSRITIIRRTLVSRLTVTRVTVADSGLYACHASNAYSSQSDTAQINVKQIMVPAKCTDNPYFSNCNLIVRSNFCHNKYYKKFCCKSCVEAGQLDPVEAELHADQPLKKK